MKNARDKSYIILFKYAFFIGIWGGIFGVLVDLDHIPKYLGLTTASRPAHIYFGILAGIIAIYCLARLGRLFYRLVLKSPKKRCVPSVFAGDAMDSLALTLDNAGQFGKEKNNGVKNRHLHPQRKNKCTK